MGGRLTFPIYSLYHGTKWAVEGFTESLHYELRPLNIRVKNVAPGPIKTEFYDRSMDVFHKESLTVYENYQTRVMKNSNEFGQNAPGPEGVAKAIWRAANSTSWKLRYTSDFLGRLTLFTRNWVPLSWYFGVIRLMTEKGFKYTKY
jgi:short-subunit dehydrogenase